MYMLNLVFKIPPAGSLFDGQFCGDDRTARSGIPEDLRKSRNWLKLKTDDPDPLVGFDPEQASWEDLGEAGTLLIPRKKDNQGKDKPDWICIRVLRHQDCANVVFKKVQLAVCFGRPVRAYQKQASPFRHNDKEDGYPLTTFVMEQTSSGPAWFFPLNKLAKWSDKQNLTHRYEFAVGLIVTTSTGEEYHYGEDPEMDIGM